MLIKGVKVTTKWGLKNIKKKTQREGERERERERDCIFDFLSFLVDSPYLGKEICVS